MLASFLRTTAKNFGKYADTTFMTALGTMNANRIGSNSRVDFFDNYSVTKALLKQRRGVSPDFNPFPKTSRPRDLYLFSLDKNQRRILPN